MKIRTTLLALAFAAFGGSFAFAAEPASAPAIVTATGTQTTPAADNVWKTFFPDGLLNAKGEKVDVNVLNNKIVGIYFSAFWCPSCREFSPELVKFRNANKDSFEVVFASADKSEEEQFKYMAEAKMEWLTIKFQSPTIEALPTKFDLGDLLPLPTLVIVSSKGDTISKKGIADVTDSPTTCLEKWKKAVK
ncbi:MAG: thioredoxin-like domain-containing protein [Candidatus Ozemobacteraceae bacterium]